VLYDTRRIAPALTYKLMTATITPRPIAWVSTQAADGTLNAAPYSFFNAMGHEPPTLVIGLLRDPQKGFKDSAENILATGEFVVNLVSAAMVEQMNITAVQSPAEVDEMALAGLGTEASAKVGPPRIKGAPVAFECTLFSAVVTGPKQTIAIGRIEAIHVADHLLIDAERGHVDNEALDLVARLHGSGWYVRGGERFQIARPAPIEGKSE
jgi:flavin reductase (DIM6/NTAB) family NADH-FMN oxidoreductase RutF